jgi:hypothetical protein
MPRRTSFLLWVALLGLIAVLCIQLIRMKTALATATAQRLALLARLPAAEAGLLAAEHDASRLGERLKAQIADPAARQDLTSDEQRVEIVRRKLAEIVARHANEERPPPLTNPFGVNYAAELVQDPAYASLYRAWYRQFIAKNYDALFDSLSVSSELQARLVDLLMERQFGRMDLLAVTEANRWTPTNPPTTNQRADLDRAQETLSGKFSGEIRALLGEQAYSQFTHFEATDQARRQVATMADRLSYTGSPLTRAQEAQLVDLVGKYTVSASGLSSSASGEMGGAFAADALTILSPQQMEELKKLQRETATSRSGGK